MFGVPNRTEFDIRFRLLGIPVRISPFFWVAAAFLGSEIRDGTLFLLWIVAVLLSILVHEFGHALSARLFGQSPEVVLYEFGGLCVYEPYRERPWRRFVVVLLGPTAGFVLAALVTAGLAARYGVSLVDAFQLDFVPDNRTLVAFCAFLVQINVSWGLLNLLPIYPLDGGQMAQIALIQFKRDSGLRWSHVLSLVCAGLAAVYLAQRSSYITAIMFGLLAFRSYQVLQSLHYQSRYGDAFEDDENWWKR
ncbi:MAG: site-2 protease family protein [Isosphaeraceae bacterium]|nr:site-2 protease family protein [Isosphaeraceae bacterium]